MTRARAPIFHPAFPAQRRVSDIRLHRRRPSRSLPLVMSALRLASAVRRSVPKTLVNARRGYAEAVSDKIKLSLVLPHQVCLQ